MFSHVRGIGLVGLMVLAAASSGHAQGHGDGHFNGLHFAGLINDHTTSNFGAWEVHGTWTLDMKAGENNCTFTATLTMERSDLYFATTPGADPNNLATRSAHTHHVLVVNGVVSQVDGGFRVTGPAGLTTVAANGATAKFETVPPTSTLQIDITGGDLVPFSNVTLTFGGAAATHFGSNPLSGVVKAVR